MNATRDARKSKLPLALGRLVHRSHILVLEGESFRFRTTLEQHQGQLGNTAVI